jgi:hypothetical protein
VKKLARMDSNHDKQNQNLLCYRYTTGQRDVLFGRDRRVKGMDGRPESAVARALPFIYPSGRVTRQTSRRK